ncbi:hypothetical protein EJB05_44446 [Eragrostis curvula]|uniref:Uncharacterized protein n=1 Tax=Eragrostis curvula TaxID=38414 RepID=A0A5J9TJQ6_9POAL|nr:hypothetical protein EJB05_44446 [Eragrostis curvula]
MVLRVFEEILQRRRRRPSPTPTRNSSSTSPECHFSPTSPSAVIHLDDDDHPPTPPRRQNVPCQSPPRRVEATGPKCTPPRPLQRARDITELPSPATAAHRPLSG